MQVIGVSVTDEAIAAVARRGTRPLIVEWAERVLRRHVRREPSLLVRVKDRERLEAAMKADGIPEEARARIRAAFEAKEPVYTSSKPALSKFLSKAADTMDWIESLPEQDRRIRRIDRMAWADAEKMAEAWHASLARARKASKGIMDGARKLFDLGDGAAFAAELTTQGALQAEGRAMGHCVGGYWNRVQSGETRIVSLRDPDGHPHVTIELSQSPVLQFADGGSMRVSHLPRNGADLVAATDEEWVAVQVRGKQNKPPVERYARFVDEWLERTGISWVEYGARRLLSGEAIQVFTAFGKTFRSAEKACDLAEKEFWKDLKGGFRARYSSTGLEQIHKHAPKERVVAFMQAAIPRLVDDFSQRVAKGSPFASAIRTSGLSAVLNNIEGAASDPAVLMKLYDAACAVDPEASSREEKVIARVPGGRDLRLVVHSLPLMPLFLLSAGYATGIEDRIAARIAPHLAAAAKEIVSDPCAVHMLRPAAGQVSEAELRGGFIFCGLATELAAATASVDKALGAWVPEARLALRKARSSGGYPHEVLNVATNLLADGYGDRIRTRVSEIARGGEALVLSVTERKAAMPVLRPQREEPAIRHYRMPR